MAVQQLYTSPGYDSDEGQHEDPETKWIQIPMTPARNANQDTK
jgi:hypothetical protein